MAEISKRMMYLVNENQLSQYDAWNGSSVQLIKISKVYIHIYIINSNLLGVCTRSNCWPKTSYRISIATVQVLGLTSGA